MGVKRRCPRKTKVSFDGNLKKRTLVSIRVQYFLKNSKYLPVVSTLVSSCGVKVNIWLPLSSSSVSSSIYSMNVQRTKTREIFEMQRKKQCKSTQNTFYDRVQYSI